MTNKNSALTRRTVLGGLVGTCMAAAFGSLHQASANPPPTLDQRSIDARQRFFGASNVDSGTGAIRGDRVVISWLGCTTYAMAMRGAVFLLDAWIPRGTVSGYVPTDPGEVAALRPDAIFIGHGHFDHAADAGRIAEASGAAVYGSTEHCAAVRQSIPTSTVRYVELGDGTTAVGDRRDFEVGDVSVTAIRHLHSTPTAPEGGQEGSAPFFPTPNTSDIVAHPPQPDDAIDLARHLFDAEGGSILYQFRIPGFAVLWHDTAGPLGVRAPQVLAQLHELPPTDVHLGAIQGFGQFTNGLRDPREYIEAVDARVFVPGHHDNFVPGVSARGETYEAPLRAELARLASPPELRFMSDPSDYLNPGLLTFSV